MPDTEDAGDKRRSEARECARRKWRAWYKGKEMPRIEMLDGFNSGWIDFEQSGNEYVFGNCSLRDVIARLLKSQK